MSFTIDTEATVAAWIIMIQSSKSFFFFPGLLSIPTVSVCWRKVAHYVTRRADPVEDTGLVFGRK